MTEQPNYCIQPWSHLFFRKTGRIQPCCRNSTALGYLSPGVPLQQLWNTPAATRVRSLIRNGDYALAGCPEDCPGTSFRHLLTSDNYSDETSQLLESIHQSWCSGELEINHQPFHIDIQTTDLCNLDCIMCHQQHKDPEMLDLGFLLQQFDFFSSTQTIRLQGGEIFLDRRIIPILEMLRSQLRPHQKIIIITNGTTLSRAELEALTDGTNPIFFIVSCDGATEITYQKVRQRKTFSQVMSTLQNLAEIENSRTDKIRIVEWNYVVMQSTWEEIPLAVRTANRLGIGIHFCPIVGVTDHENIFLASSEEKKHIRHALEQHPALSAEQITAHPSIASIFRLLDPRDGI